MKYSAAFLVLLLGLVPSIASAAAPPSAPVSIVTGDATYQASSPLAPTLRNLEPAPGSVVRAFFPRLAAVIDTHGSALHTASVHVYVDGKDVTRIATITGNAISYLPHEHLKAGWHDVFVQGADSAKHAFSQAWVFRSESPDVDDPISGDDGFAFTPVGFGGPFVHFFAISPFDGFGSLQFCNFNVPLTQAFGAPVFFGTVPATFGFGQSFFGCNPGFLFTPFGIGQTNPFFFPIEIAGPGFFQGGVPRRRFFPPGIAGPGIFPQRTGAVSMPVFRTNGSTMFRAPALPGMTVAPGIRGTTFGTGVQAVPVMGMPSARGVPVRGGVAVPRTIVVPHPSIPH